MTFLSAAAAWATPLPGSEALSISGAFQALPHPPPLDGGAVEGTVIGEWPGHTGSGRGATGVFKTPHYLEFEMAGHAKLAGMKLFLEDAVSPGQTLTLALARDAGAFWRTRRWTLPAAWQNRNVRLVIEDAGAAGNDRWVGITLPRAYNIFTPIRALYTVKALIYLVLEWTWLILPGLACALWFSRREAAPAHRTLMLMFAGSALAALIGFYVFVFSLPAGKLYSVTVLLASAAAIGLKWKRFIPVFQGAVSSVLLVWILASVFYLSAGLLYRNDEGIGEYIQDRFFDHQLPPDNLLPFILGEAIYHRAPFRPVFFADIQSSDRPPLQTGFVLMQRVFWAVPDLQYLILGVLLQTSWIPALWVLLRRMGFEGPPLLGAIVVTACSQFAFVHELFVWPKLLSAAFGLLALSSFAWLTKETPTRLDALLAGVMTALALLSHGGVVMTVIGFAVLTAIWHRPGLRWFFAFCCAAVVIYLPWLLYQKLYDPPGDALTKLHLAGVIDRSHSLGWLIVTNYSKIGFLGWLHNKWDNIKLLFWLRDGGNLFQIEGRRIADFSDLTFFSLVPALGFALLGFPLAFLRRQKHRAAILRLFAVCGASLLAWYAVMFAPEATVIHQGSFVTVILLFTALALSVDGFSRRALSILVVAQSMFFVFFTIFAKPAIGNGNGYISDTVPDPSMFLVFFLCAIVLVFFIWLNWQRISFYTEKQHQEITE